MKNSPTRHPKPRLYSLTSYDRCAKARWLLTELGVDFESRQLDREKREYESPEFLKLNPMGQVPVLEMDDQAIFESGAICAYLGDLYADRGIAPALNAPERAEYQQWMYFASSTLDVFQVRIMVIEDIPPGEVQAAKLSALQSHLRDALAALDRALTKSAFLVGNRFTVADIGVSYHLYWLKLWPELDVVMQDFHRVTAYVERMKSMPSAVKADVFSYEG
jgi:glutathione S-transferase